MFQIIKYENDISIPDYQVASFVDYRPAKFIAQEVPSPSFVNHAGMRKYKTLP